MPGQHSSKRTWHQFQSVYDIKSDLTGPRIELKTSRPVSDVFYHYSNRLLQVEQMQNHFMRSCLFIFICFFSWSKIHNPDNRLCTSPFLTCTYHYKDWGPLGRIFENLVSHDTKNNPHSGIWPQVYWNTRVCSRLWLNIRIRNDLDKWKEKNKLFCRLCIQNLFSKLKQKMKSYLHYTRRITLKYVANGGAHHRSLAPAATMLPKTSEQWRHCLRFDWPENPISDFQHR